MSWWSEIGCAPDTSLALINLVCYYIIKALERRDGECSSHNNEEKCATGKQVQ